MIFTHKGGKARWITLKDLYISVRYYKCTEAGDRVINACLRLRSKEPALGDAQLHDFRCRDSLSQRVRLARVCRTCDDAHHRIILLYEKL